MRISAFSVVVALVCACGSTEPAPVRTPPSGPASWFLAIELDSEMSASFQLVAATVSVDGVVVAARDVPVPEGSTEEIQPLPTPLCIYRGMVQVGTHDVRADLSLRGNGYGVFSYLRGYRFRVDSTTQVDVTRETFGVGVTATAFERGGATAPLEDRPAIRWQTTPHARPDLGCQPER
jgi:hypothetical protein